MEIDSAILRQMINDAAVLAVKKYRIEKNEEPPYISQNRAHILYGRRIVEGWVKKGYIKPVKDGDKNSKVRYDSFELAMLSKTSNR